MNRFKNRRLAAMALAVLVGTTGMTAFAGAPAPSATGYDAYRLMDATKELKDGCGHGEDGAHEESCYGYTYKVNEKYQDVLQKAAADAGLAFDLDGDGNVSNEELVAGVGALDGDNAAAYADMLYAAAGSMEPDASTDSSTFGQMEDGFYLIASRPSGDGPSQAATLSLKAVHGQTEDMDAQVHVPAFSQKILVKKAASGNDVTPGDATEKAETDTPDTTDGADAGTGAGGEETKDDAGNDGEIKDDADGDVYEETDAADIGAGEEVMFEARLSMPENIEDLENWGFNIHVDTKGLKLTQEPKLFVNGKEARVRGEVSGIPEDGFGSGVIGVTGTHLTVDGEDAAYDKDTVVTMRYACTLDEGHVIGGEGNVSEAWAEFLPDMEDASKNMETVHDKNAVFTYQLGVDSVDADHEGLPGAGFSLYKQDGDGWTEIMLSGEADEDKTSFSFTSLDAGTYKLTESKIPAGCVKAEDLVFEIRPGYETDGENPVLASLDVYVDGSLASADKDGSLFTVDKAEGAIYTELVSGTAAHMPSTGANTRILVAASGIVLLAIGGGIYVAYRKKTKE